MKRIDKFENQQRACQDIEAIAKTQCLTYIDASLVYAEKNNFEVEYVAELLSKNDLLRSRIEEEAEDLNFLKKKARLPI
jgi:hypothetical protein